VVALDGRTGQERWHYRRAGARTTQIGASPTGDWVMVTLRATGSHATGVRVVALDGQTGEVGFDEVTDGGPFDIVGLDLTDHVLLGGAPRDGSYAGFRLADGQRLWDWHMPEDCHWSGVGQGHAAAAQTALVMMACERDRDGAAIVGDIVLVALDDRTGREVWRFTTSFEFEALSREGPLQLDMRLQMSHDRSVANLHWFPRSSDVAFGSLVDATSGTVLLTSEDAEWSSAPAHIDRELVMAGSNEVDVDYRIRTFHAGLDVSIPVVCSGSIGSVAARAADAVVAHCYQQSGPQVVAVVPWLDPQAAHMIEVDLGPTGDGHLFRVVAFPTVTVVMSDGVERIVGLR
jgi:hypothetical protein